MGSEVPLDEKERRMVWCGNLQDKVTEELLYELFLQAGPLENVSIPMRDGRSRGFGFITYKHESSVMYAIDVMQNVSLFGRQLRVKTKGGRGGDSQPNSRQHYPNSSQNYQSPLLRQPFDPQTIVNQQHQQLHQGAIALQAMLFQNQLRASQLQRQGNYANFGNNQTSPRPFRGNDHYRSNSQGFNSSRPYGAGRGRGARYEEENNNKRQRR